MPNIDEWKFSLDVAWDDPWYRWQSMATIVAATIGSGLFLWRMIPEGLRSGLLVTHYNLYVGIDAVSPWPWVFLFPGALLAILATDLLASGFLFRHDRVASRVLLCTGSVFTIISLVGAYFLSTVNL
jgi:hypothetical protein